MRLERSGSGRAGRQRLEEAVAAYRDALKEQTRERVPLDWARTHMNLGNALTTLGERENDPAKLKQAIAAHREALKENTRERVRLEWAKSQVSLGNALRALGERESGTARLEEAVASYREALRENTRERAPLDRAINQNNLGNALRALGERESGTAETRRGRCRLSRRLEGTNPRARAAPMGLYPDESRFGLSRVVRQEWRAASS